MPFTRNNRCTNSTGGSKNMCQMRWSLRSFLLVCFICMGKIYATQFWRIWTEMLFSLIIMGLRFLCQLYDCRVDILIMHTQTSPWHQCCYFCATHQSPLGNMSLARAALLSELGSSKVIKGWLNLFTRKITYLGWIMIYPKAGVKYPPFAQPGNMNS